MNKQIFKTFIEECAKEDISDWAEKRGFNLELLKSLKIGKCTAEAMGRVKDQFELKDIELEGFKNKAGQWKYYDRIIIPYSEYYFAARDSKGLQQKFKNLFPKGHKKQPFFIYGQNNADFYITEGETDAIRIKQEWSESFVYSLGGCSSKNLFSDFAKKIIDINPKRIIFALDNDEPGKKALKNFVQLIEDSTKREYFKDKLYHISFDSSKKDIDDYFKAGGHKDNVVYESIIIKTFEPINRDSIYNKFILPIDNYMQNAEEFYKFQPYFYDKIGIFWFWNKDLCTYQQVDDIDVMRTFDRILGFKGQTVNPKLKNNTLEAMKRFGRDKFPKEAKVKWVQFKDKAYSVFSQKIHQVTPEYFFTNPIPWEIGQNDSTPVLDKLFEEWVGKDRVIDLYEIIAYCCYRSVPIQTLVCLFGSGRNGKSCFLKIIDKFIGKENVCSTELDLIEGRNKSKFEVFKLYKKLVCIMGETNYGVMESSSLLKRLTGGDKIGYEKKGKDPFDAENYAKIIIASNSLPSCTDTSDGWVRRWHIIRFPNEFSEGKDILSMISDEEYRNLALKCMKILPNLVKRGSFSNQGTIEQRRINYMSASNPLPIFLETYCDRAEEYFISYNELYTGYIQYLKNNKQRRVKMKEFKTALEEEGYFAEKTSKPDGKNDDGFTKYKIIYWVEGLRLNQKFFTDFAQKINFANRYSAGIQADIGIHKFEQIKQKEEIIDNNLLVPSETKEQLEWDEKVLVWQKCTIETCKDSPCNLDMRNVPYCRKHWEECASK